MSDQFASYPELSNQTVFVIGAGGGIGLRMAGAFASNRCNVMISDVDGAALESSAASLRSDHPAAQIETVIASVTDEQALDTAFTRTAETFGRLDIAVCAAGISANQPSMELTAEEWRRVIDIDLTGAFLTAKAAAQRMRDHGGIIMNLSSMWGVAASPERAAYCAAKAGVGAMTASLAVEWAELGIRVNAIGPGYIRTALTEELIDQGRLDPEVIERATPLGRFGSLDEVANIGLFLASNGARFITGQTIVSDGGWTSNGYLPARLQDPLPPRSPELER